jgi:hypothetical protein
MCKGRWLKSLGARWWWGDIMGACSSLPRLMISSWGGRQWKQQPTRLKKRHVFVLEWGPWVYRCQDMLLRHRRFGFISCWGGLILTLVAGVTLLTTRKILSALSLLNTCLLTQPRSLFPGRLGAYYQTSLAHVYATDLVLANFRRFNKHSPLFLYIDRVHNNTTKNVEWNKYHPIVFMPSLSSKLQSGVTYGTYFSTVDASVAYVNRIIEASRDLDWLILLEDDVWVCNHINTTALVYDMNGQCLAKYDPSVWTYMTPGSCYGGYGGFVLRASFLRNMRVDREYVQSILAHIKRPIASDELLSALFLQSNGTIGKIQDYAEEITSTSSPVIVHQMKHFY